MHWSDICLDMDARALVWSESLDTRQNFGGLFFQRRGVYLNRITFRDTLGKAAMLCYAVFGILITDYSDIVLSTPIVR